MKYCAKLVDFVKEKIFSEDFLNRNRKSEKDFTRKRILTFPVLIMMLLNIRKSSINTELGNFFKSLDNTDVAKQVVTASAFCQARQKVKHGAFIELNSELGTYFYKSADIETWYGYNLLAVDGSTSKVPRQNDIIDYFGALHPQKGEPCPLARVSQLFDVINKFTVDAIIAPYSIGERELASIHAFQLRPTDLLLLDRGYASFLLFRIILHTGANCCARVKLNQWAAVRSFYESGQRDAMVSIHPSVEAKKQCQELGLDINPINLRLLRIDLPGGEVEILATSLTDSEIFHYDLFQELYHHRWPVEEDYKVMKHRIEIENWSGETVESVFQDFHAKVFVKNFTAALAHCTKKAIEQKTSHRKYEYQINFTQALAKMKNVVGLLILRDNVTDIIEALLEAFIAFLEPIRPGRKEKRGKWKTRSYYPAYKPIS